MTVAGIERIIVGFFATIGMWAFFAVILPVGVMLVTLYLVRLLPLAGRQSTRRSADPHERTKRPLSS
jgi:fatty acid desaturase